MQPWNEAFTISHTRDGDVTDSVFLQKNSIISCSICSMKYLLFKRDHFKYVFKLESSETRNSTEVWSEIVVGSSGLTLNTKDT